MLYEEATKTLFCGDLFTQVGAPAPVVSDDLVPDAMSAEQMFHSSSLAPQTGRRSGPSPNSSRPRSR